MSVYDTPANWAASTFYRKHAIAIYASDGYTYYATQDHTSAQASSPNDNFLYDKNTFGYWDGVDTDDRGTTLGKFFWKMSYGVPINVTPSVNVTKFGDGYEQTTANGINNTLLVVNISIKGMDLDMANAVGHFLYTKQGATSFFWTPFAPFDVRKKFKCREWSITPDFYNNYDLQGKFEEVGF